MNYRTPLEMLRSHAENSGDRPFLHQPANRQWRIITWKESLRQVQVIAAGLQAQGLQPGDKVAILAKNSAEWFLADWAIMMAGMISVPIYSTAGESTLKYILEHSEAKAVFVGKLDDVTAANNVLDGSIPRIAFPYPTANADMQWNQWLQDYQPIENPVDPSLDDIMSIVYTSGSTGNPKGVIITFKNFASVSETHSKSMELGPEDRAVSYLPLAHITERGVIQGPSLYGGGKIYFVESLDTFVDDLKYAQPTLFLSVPRLWTRFQSGVYEKLPAKKLEKLLKIPLIGKLIAKKVRTGLGLNSARLFGSGSAPISPSILQWYTTIGVNICEGWGMTETTGLSCTNLPFEASRIGTIGMPCDCVEMSLSDEGEIIIKGDAVFKEYYKNPEATAEAFTDGWFHTGDRALKNPDGSFKIIGRVKEEFKTGKGKYVAPVPIESLLASNANIEQICVMGTGRKQPVAVIVLAEHLQNAERAPIRESLQETLTSVNEKLESHQKLDCLIVAKDAWTIENQYLTPTLKIKRTDLEDHYRTIAMKGELSSVIWEDEV
ncbi:AMP-binding protein [Reinekea marina]|uniref:AMP-binding protein n=1 Tax=Reinekea marina TaxID=1310421 RepID=A0ABV7WUV0_9GAMM|nr:AMP-binding protein [Reinekea marina]MDN3649029.1 AMP-binding protein [Reinekea marina]